MNRKHTLGRIVAIEDVIVKSDFVAPATSGEEAADTATQAAKREAVERQRSLEREQVVWYSVFHAHGTSRARQLEASARLDVIEAELHALRSAIPGTTQRVAKTDAVRGVAGLNYLLHAPTISKGDLPDPFELDNSIGLSTQPKVTR